LDMRMNPEEENTAEAIVNRFSEKELADLIARYGEDPWAMRIAKCIVRARRHARIRSTSQLAEIVKEAIPARHRPRRINPATRTFQALRIAVNNELEVLEKGLENSLKTVCVGGRIVIITFHSLEDRIVKRFFKRESIDCICPPEQPFCTCSHKATLKVITKKAVKPSQEEIVNNPRSRSAKIRVAEKI